MNEWTEGRTDGQIENFIHGGFVKITIVSLVYRKALQYLQIVF